MSFTLINKGTGQQVNNIPPDIPRSSWESPQISVHVEKGSQFAEASTK
jgi:hypothetical protein